MKSLTLNDLRDRELDRRLLDHLGHLLVGLLRGHGGLEPVHHDALHGRLLRLAVQVPPQLIKGLEAVDGALEQSPGLRDHEMRHSQGLKSPAKPFSG